MVAVVLFCVIKLWNIVITHFANSLVIFYTSDTSISPFPFSTPSSSFTPQSTPPHPKHESAHSSVLSLCHSFVLQFYFLLYLYFHILTFLFLLYSFVWIVCDCISVGVFHHTPQVQAILPPSCSVILCCVLDFHSSVVEWRHKYHSLHCTRAISRLLGSRVISFSPTFPHPILLLFSSIFILSNPSNHPWTHPPPYTRHTM